MQISSVEEHINPSSVFLSKLRVPSAAYVSSDPMKPKKKDVRDFWPHVVITFYLNLDKAVQIITNFMQFLYKLLS